MKKHLWHGTCVVIFNSGDIPGVCLTGASSGELVFGQVNSSRVITYHASASSRQNLVDVFNAVRERLADRACEQYCSEISSFTTHFEKIY